MLVSYLSLSMTLLPGECDRPPELQRSRDEPQATAYLKARATWSRGSRRPRPARQQIIVQPPSPRDRRRAGAVASLWTSFDHARGDLDSAARVTVVEVGPRDGLQNEAQRVPTPVKIGT